VRLRGRTNAFGGCFALPALGGSTNEIVMSAKSGSRNFFITLPPDAAFSCSRARPHVQPAYLARPDVSHVEQPSEIEASRPGRPVRYLCAVWMFSHIVIPGYAPAQAILNA